MDMMATEGAQDPLQTVLLRTTLDRCIKQQAMTRQALFTLVMKKLQRLTMDRSVIITMTT